MASNLRGRVADARQQQQNGRPANGGGRPPQPSGPVVPALSTRKPTGVVPWPLILIEGGEKTGKAQPLNARIATPTGWTTMGELEAGSRVIGSDGRPVAVTAVYDRGERDIYRFTFSDGAQVEACDEHLWATHTSSALHRTYSKGPKKGLRNYRPSVIRTTAELRELVLNGTVVHIPVTSAVQYDAGIPLPLDAYMLGLLLGDGGLSRPSYPTFTTGDPELFAALAAALPDGDSLTYLPRTITAGIKGGHVTNALRMLGLMAVKSAAKFIPGQYMTASPGDRLALLQGLMDTDGGMEKKSVTFTSVSFALASQVQELVRSLGGTCSMRSKRPGYTNPAGERVVGQTAYKLTVRLPLGSCPFRLTRKAQAWAAARPAFHTPPRRTVKAVEFVGRMAARCITVDAADHLYLTDHFVVTHNSYSCAVLSASQKIGRTLWLDLGEGAADEYGAIPGARYEVIEHDGSWDSVMGQVYAAKAEAQRAAAAGEPPVVLVIDSVTAEWEMLKDWASDRARNSQKGRAILSRDPNAEITVTMNLWNDATARHRRLMTTLMTFPGVVVITARGGSVAAMEDGKPVEGKKSYRVEGHKSLAFDASLWIRLAHDAKPVVVGARSVHHGLRPGIDPPKTLDADWTLESLIFDVLRCEPAKAHARDLVEPRKDSLSPQEIRDEACDPRTSVERLRELWRIAKRSGFEQESLMNEAGDEEALIPMLERLASERAASPADGGAQVEDTPGEPWAGEPQ